MRTIAVVTVSRADYGILVPLLEQLRDRPDVTLRIIAASAHLSAAHGSTARDIEADGFTIDERVEMLLASNRHEAAAASIGLGVIGFAKAYERLRPDLVVLLGDRFETMAAAVAALALNVPVAHIAGGELTAGAIDDAIRHAITKIAHLHFVSTDEYAQRVRQMGEEPWRVFVTGTMSVDNVERLRPFLSLPELRSRFQVQLEAPFLLVTFHPVTLESADVEAQTAELMAALDRSGLPILFTMPNADPGSQSIRTAIHRFCESHPSSQTVESLGAAGYFAAMSHAIAMVGNSSSGIVEAPSFGLPVVNVGTRQQGRMRAPNIIDVACEREKIAGAIDIAISDEFRRRARGVANPYGDGHAAGRIAGTLCSMELGRLLRKQFVDIRC